MAETPEDRGASAAHAASVFDELARRKLVILSGKGGVGRTTTAALVGLSLASRGRRVLVATTGLDDRLAWMLGADALSSTPVQVAPGLSVQRLVPQQCVREYGTLVLRSARISSAVFDNRVVRRLLRAIPGLDDFAVLGKAWHEAVRSGNWDVVVYDGPATGHLLYTLGVPRAILGTVSAGPLTREAELMRGHLEDPTCVQAVLVGLPEKWPLTELGELGAALRERLGIDVAAILVNGVWPGTVPPLEPPERGLDPEGVVAPVFEHLARIGEIGRRHAREIEAFCASDAAVRCGSKPVLSIPWRFAGILDQGDARVMEAALEQSPLCVPGGTPGAGHSG